MYNKLGIKYLMYRLTIVENNKTYMLLPLEIRKIIWDFAHIYPYIQCFICDKILISLSINIDKNANKSEDYTIINGMTKCNKCFID